MCTTCSTIRRAAGIGAIAAAMLLGLAPARASALTASIDAAPAQPATGATVSFTASITPTAGATVTATTWLFGDGAFATGASTTHAYSVAGNYTVTLSVTEQSPAGPTDPAPPPPQTITVTRAILVNTPPTAVFTFAPVNPVPGSGITFTSTSGDSDGAIRAQAWDLDDDGRFDDAFTPVATTTFLTAGTHRVSLQVTDNLGGTAIARQSIVVNRPPVASFTFSPAKPLVGQTITFTSRSTDADGTIVSQEWDLTGNGLFSDATGRTATRTFSQSGAAIVRLRVTDNRGAQAVFAATIPVGGPPIASFDFTPASPTAGRPVTFQSTSRDIDGALVSQQWDLDNNGVFNDAAGPVAQKTFPVPGIYTVALRVKDTSGLTDVAFQSVSVVAAAPPPAAPAAAPAAGGAPPAAPRVAPPQPARFLLPFPVVRIAGRVSGRSTRIRLLEVRAPVGARIRVTCKGRGCPKRALTAVVRRTPVRFRGMRRRLAAGAVVQVYVRANGRIGKYTRFRIRRNRAPLRSDMCLPPTTRGPAPCTA